MSLRDHYMEQVRVWLDAHGYEDCKPIAEDTARNTLLIAIAENERLRRKAVEDGDKYRRHAASEDRQAEHAERQIEELLDGLMLISPPFPGKKAA